MDRQLDLVLLGAGATGLEVCDIALGIDPNLRISVIDDDSSVDLVPWNKRGVMVQHGRGALLDLNVPYIVSVGNPRVRDGMIRWAGDAGLRPHPALKHPTAVEAHGVEVGDGSVVYQNTVMSTDVRIGDHSIVFPLVSLGHNVSFGQNCVIGPGVTVSGDVVVEDGVFIGSGSVLLPRLRVGAGAVVGAGSVVTKDLPPHVIAYGNPAVPRRDTPA